MELYPLGPETPASLPSSHMNCWPRVQKNHTPKAEGIPGVLGQCQILTWPLRGSFTSSCLLPFSLWIPKSLFIHSCSADLWCPRMSPSVTCCVQSLSSGDIQCCAQSPWPLPRSGSKHTPSDSPGLLATGMASPCHPLSSSSSECSKNISEGSVHPCSPL